MPPVLREPFNKSRSRNHRGFQPAPRQGVLVVHGDDDDDDDDDYHHCGPEPDISLQPPRYRYIPRFWGCARHFLCLYHPVCLSVSIVSVFSLRHNDAARGKGNYLYKLTFIITRYLSVCSCDGYYRIHWH